MQNWKFSFPPGASLVAWVRTVVASCSGEEDMGRLAGQGAVLLRVSSNRQETDRQITTLVSWLGKKGYEVPDKPKDFGKEIRKLGLRLYEDKESRDMGEHRPDFQRLLTEAQQGEVQWVVVESHDRLGYTDEVELSHFIYLFRRSKCRLWSAVDDVCFSEDSDINAFSNVFKGRTSRSDQLKISKNVTQDKEQRARRGEYLGGKGVPYGLDVVCRRGDKEVWRYVQTGELQGIRITPDGHQEITSGVPKHGKGETTYYAPSVREERLETVRQVYQWYDSEAVGFQQLANRLNDAGVDPVYGTSWYATRVRDIIDKPIYIGRPSQFRFTASRFHDRTLEDGAVTLTEKRAEYGQKKKAHRTSPDQWAMPDTPVFTPLVNPEVWARCQAKRQKTGRANPQKSDRLWLMKLVICDHCGKPMVSGKRPVGLSRTRNKPGEYTHIPAYRCSVTAKLGHARNPHGCKSHTVPHERIEKIATEWLDRHGFRLNALMNLDTGRQADRIAWEMHERQDDLAIFFHRMERFLVDRLGQGTHTIDMDTVHIAGKKVVVEGDWLRIEHLYRAVYRRRGEELRALLVAKEAEATRMFRLFAQLDPDDDRGIAAAKVMRRDLDAEIEGIKGELVPLDEEVNGILDEINVLATRYADARIALEKGTNRHKAEAVRKVIKEIRLRFTTGSYHSKLQSVTIVPLVGSPEELRQEASASRTP